MKLPTLHIIAQLRKEDNSDWLVCALQFIGVVLLARNSSHIPSTIGEGMGVGLGRRVSGRGMDGDERMMGGEWTGMGGVKGRDGR